MKTREAIQLEYENQRAAISNQYNAQVEAARAARDAALAELEDPMARLIAAARDMPIDHRNGRWETLHFPDISPVAGCANCAAAVEFRNAIDYAEQRRDGDHPHNQERDQLRAALQQVTRRRTAWLSIGAANNVAEIRVERELFEEWVRLLEGQK